MSNKQQQQPPVNEADRIRARKRTVIDTLNNKFQQPVWMDRLLKICGGDESRIMKALNSFITYIMNDDGGKEDRKAYIADCSLSSISTAFLEAFQMGIEVGGGRDHAYLVNYAGQCELDISYKGFVYALNKHFDNAFVDARCVFEGDKFDCEISDTTATYKHVPANPFEQSWDKLQGCFCYFTYTLRDGGGKVSRLIMIPRGADAKTPDSLEMIRSKAKGSWAWKDFPFEQCKKSTIRRAAKIPFASIDFGDEDVNPETVDNKHYQLEAGQPADRLRLMMEKHQEMMADEKPAADPKTGEDTPQDAGSHAGGEQPAVSAGTNETAPAGVAPASGELTDEENEKRFAEISDADFGDDKGTIIDQPAAENQQTVAEPVDNVAPGEWDGKTLVLGGKSTEKDFASSQQAMVYLKKVMTQRKHKASRLTLVNENPLLIAALIKDGFGNSVTELHKLADQGE